MPCYHPMPAWRTPGGSIELWKEPPNATEALSLPCGGCIGCRSTKAAQWTLRCQLELQDHDRAAFTTLTYDPDRVPPTLQRRDLQLFLKRLRKRADKALRFFACGEYGEKNGRPHFHGILFGLDDEQRIHDAWKHGFTRTDPVTPERIAYTAGYCHKKLGIPGYQRGDTIIDRATGEILAEYQPPFIQMSRRPGIGSTARQFKESWRLYAVRNGDKLPVPRYLHAAWKAAATTEEIESTHYEAYQLALTRDTSRERLESAEAIAVARQHLRKERRTL